MREEPNTKYTIKRKCPWCPPKHKCEYCGGTGTVTIVCPEGGVTRNQRMAETYKKLGSVARTGVLYGLSATRVHQILDREYPEILNRRSEKWGKKKKKTNP